MTNRRSGHIPPHHRRLAYSVAGLMFVLLLATGLFLKLVGGLEVSWFWIVVTPVFMTALIVFYLWVRLSD